MNRTVCIAVAALALALGACKNNPPAPKADPATEASKSAAADPAKEAGKEGAKEAVKEAAKEAAKEVAKEAPKDIAKPAPPTADEIEAMKKKAGAESIDDRKVAVNQAVSALQLAEVDDNFDFKADQPWTEEVARAIGIACGATTDPNLPDEAKARFKAEVVPALAQVARNGTSALRKVIAAEACTSLASSPEALAGIDTALAQSPHSAGWVALYRCVTYSGPNEYTVAVERKPDLDRFALIDRQIAIFLAANDQKVLGEIAAGWVGFEGKNDKLAAAIVAQFDKLDGQGRGYLGSVLGETCAKAIAKPLLDKLATAAVGTLESGVKANIDEKFKACKK